MLTKVALLLLLPLVVRTQYSQVFPPDYSFNYSLHASRLHADLLAGYVKSIPPMSHRRVNYSAAGTDVEVQLRFFKALGLDGNAGHLAIKVWLRLQWVDLRLAWDPADYGGIETIPFHANSYTTPEDTEIWLPDLTAYNSVEGFMNTFDASMARVRSTGHVYWSRPGSLNLMCRFSGLVMFPFDVLECPLDIGGWVAGGGTQGIYPGETGCVDLSHGELTSQTSYQAVQIAAVSCKQMEYTYPCCPHNPFPVLRYRVYLSRASGYYVIWTLVPSTIYTILSFAVFFMSFEVCAARQTAPPDRPRCKIDRDPARSLLPRSSRVSHATLACSLRSLCARRRARGLAWG